MVDDAERVRELGRVTTIAENGDLVTGKDVFEIEIVDKESEEEALRLSREATSSSGRGTGRSSRSRTSSRSPTGSLRRSRTQKRQRSP